MPNSSESLNAARRRAMRGRVDELSAEVIRRRDAEAHTNARLVAGEASLTEARRRNAEAHTNARLIRGEASTENARRIDATARAQVRGGEDAERQRERNALRREEARTRALESFTTCQRVSGESSRVASALWSRSVVAQPRPSNPQAQTDAEAITTINKFSSAMADAAYDRFACSLCGEMRPKKGAGSVAMDEFDTKLRPYASDGIFPESAATDECFLRGARCSVSKVVGEEIIFERFHFPFIRSLCCDGVAPMCRLCVMSLAKNKLPETAAIDFGTFPDSFPPLRLAEMLAISRAYSCAVLLKVKDGSDIVAEALRGSTISFGHDAEQSLLLSLPRNDLSALMKLHFVSTLGRAESVLRPTLLREGALFRSDVVRMYLEFLVRKNFRYEGILLDFEGANVAQQISRIVLDASVVGNEFSEGIVEDISACAVADMHAVLIEPAVLDPQTAAKQVVSALRMARKGAPINEFESNDVILSCAFPWLFPIGNVGPTVGPVPVWLRAHLFNFFDGRFERDLLFRLHNVSQMRRHAVARNVKIKARAVGFLAGIVVSQGFDERLAQAMADKKAPASIRLFESLLVGVRVAQAGIPFSESERHKGYIELLAKMRFHGLPTWFVTLTPSAIESEFALRFSSLNGEAFPVLEYEARVAKICSNPVAAAKFFQSILKNLFEHVFLVPECTGKSNRHVSEAKNGPFGEVVSWHLVVENQKRGLLHAHIILWTRFGPAQMDDAIREHGGMPLWLRNYINSVMCTTASDNFWLKSNNFWDRKERWLTPSLHATAIPHDFESEGMAEAYWAVLHNCCLHRLHKQSCWKYSSTNVCRYAKPERRNNGETEVVEIWPGGGGYTVVGATHQERGLCEPAPCSHLGHMCICGDSLHRMFREGTQIIFPKRRVVAENSEAAVLRRGNFVDDRILCPHNKVLTLSALCNNDVKMFGCVEQGFACGHYVSKYVSKAEDGRGVLGETVQRMLADIPLDERNGNTRMANRIANAVLSADELYDTIASWILIGGRGVMASEKCWFVFPWPAVSEFHRQDNNEGSSDESESECSDTQLDDYIEQVHTSEHLGGNNAFEGDLTGDIFHPDGDMLPNINEDADSDASLDSTPQPVAVEQHKQYLNRPRELSGLSLLEFACCIIVQKTEILPGHGRQVPGEGRRRAKKMVFKCGALRTTYCCVARLAAMTPVLGGEPPPLLPQNPVCSGSRKRAKRELFAAYYSLLVFPWNIPADEATDSEDARLGLVQVMNFEELSTRVNADKNSDDVVVRGRCRYIINCTHGLRLSKRKFSDLDVFRKAEAETKETCARLFHNDVSECDDALGGAAVQLRKSNAMDIESILARNFSASRTWGSTWSEIAGLVPSFIHQGAPAEFSLRDVDLCLAEMRGFSEELERRSFVTTAGVFDSIGQRPQEMAERNLWLGLSDEQKEIAVKVFASCCEDGDCEERLFFVHGPPGCGKTFLIRSLSDTLRETFGPRAVMTLAPTGSAASNLFTETMTIHSGLMINPMGPTKKLPANKKLLLEKRLSGTKLVVVDEISMVSPELLSCINTRIQQATGKTAPFGGLCILACGDFFQIRPVFGKTLLEASLSIGNMRTTAATITGATLWQRFRLLKLQTQRRAAACQIQGDLVRRIRSEKKIAADLFSSLRPLSPQDFEIDPQKWSTARFISFSNAEVDAVNFSMAKNFARMTGQRLLWWKNSFPKLSSREAASVDAKLFRSRGWFCKGAPAIFVANVFSAVGVVNGGSAEALESIVFPLGANLPGNMFHPLIAGENVEMEVPFPAAVVVRISSRGCLEFPSLAGGVGGISAVVPLDKISGDLQIGGRKSIPMVHFPYDLGFASTYHRCQGQTLKAVVLSFSGPLTYEMVLVGLSRVCFFDDIRVMLPNIESVEREKKKITKLTPNTETLRWLEGTFDTEGRRKYH